MALIVPLTAAVEALPSIAVPLGQAVSTAVLPRIREAAGMPQTPIGSNPTTEARRFKAEQHLSGNVARVSARVAFLGRMLLGHKKTTKYENRGVSEGFVVSGGRGFSSTMTVGTPLERAVGLSGGWASLDATDKKAGLENLLRKQILTGDFSTHQEVKVDMLKKAILRFVIKAPKKFSIRLLSLLLGKNLTAEENKTLVRRLATLDTAAQGRILAKVAKRLGMKKDGEIASLEGHLKIEDFLGDEKVVAAVFLNDLSAETFERLFKQEYMFRSPDDSKLLKELSNNLQITDVQNLATLIEALAPEENQSLDHAYFMETCFETLRAINSNRSWVKSISFGGIIFAGATVLTNALTLKATLIALGIAGAIAVSPYLIPIVVGIGISLIFVGFLLNNCETQKMTLQGDRRTVDALLRMNKEAAKEIDRLKDSEEAEHLKAFLVDSEAAIKFLHQTLEELKKAHILEGESRFSPLKRFVLGDSLKARIVQMERLLDERVMERRESSTLAANSRKQLTALAKDTRKIINTLSTQEHLLSKAAQAHHLKTLVEIEARMARIQKLAKSKKFWVTEQGAKSLKQKPVDVIALTQAEMKKMRELLASLPTLTPQPARTLAELAKAGATETLKKSLDGISETLVKIEEELTATAAAKKAAAPKTDVPTIRPVALRIAAENAAAEAEKRPPSPTHSVASAAPSTALLNSESDV